MSKNNLKSINHKNFIKMKKTSFIGAKLIVALIQSTLYR